MLNTCNDISVVMAVWRGDSPDQIAAAIYSVLEQTVRPTEFVVVVSSAVAACTLLRLVHRHSCTVVLRISFRVLFRAHEFPN